MSVSNLPSIGNNLVCTGQNYSVAVLLATSHRSHLLMNRALPSIEQQSRTPARVVIVDDSGDEAAADRTGLLVRKWQPVRMDVDFLRNRRTKGAAGAWNSGLDHLLRTCSDPRQQYVAILDDDDQWHPQHLRTCLATAEQRSLDMVAAPFLREEENAETLLTSPPASLDAADFLVGNPGIQGSNLVCRLSVLLEAGLFDESLPSCTDRDLCIRIAELPGVRYGSTTEPTVHHFACESRDRLSTPGSHDKVKGLDRFFRKYKGRMSHVEKVAFCARAEELFGWTESSPSHEAEGRLRGGGLSSAPPTLAPRQAPPHLIVGLVADNARYKEVGSLLDDLHGLADATDLSGYDVLILENGDDGTPSDELRTLIERERSNGLRIHFIDRTRHLQDATSGRVLDGGVSKEVRLPIAHARTVLQTYLYAFAKRRPGAVVWIIDDDMRLDPLFIEKDGSLKRRASKIAPILRELRRLRAGGMVDIAIGSYTGAAPLPSFGTVRVQFVDLIASLWWLASQKPTDWLPDRGMENAKWRSGRRDYYYDLSRKETDRLEAPFWITPAFPGEKVGSAFVRAAGIAERILAGEQVFRPLALEANLNPLDLIGEGLQRGGNTFVLDVESLKLAPNPSPIIAGRPSRRADMIWTLLQKRYFSRQVVTLPLGLFHDRSHVAAAELNVDDIVDDIRGYAMFSALEDIPGVFKITSDDRGIRMSEEMVVCFAQRVHKYLEERRAAFRLSFYRIRGLIRVLRRLMDDPEKWWQGHEYQTAVRQLRKFSDRLADFYKLETLHRIEHGTEELDVRRIAEFLEHLPIEIESHRRRLSDISALVHSLEGDRIANAKAIASRLAVPIGVLKVLGCGMEGVALTDGTRVFKVFDYWWKRSHKLSAPAFLRSLVGAWKDTHALYPLHDFVESGHQKVLTYSYEVSTLYKGGHGSAMVNLVAECRRHGIVCRNIDPDNLRVVNGRIRLIDYGSDIHPFDEDEFHTMCQRAWLSYRWANRSNLKNIMRDALTDEKIPELDGFERFYEAIRKVTGQHETPKDVVLNFVGKAERILDYGCGKGRLAREISDMRRDVFGYDPEEAYRSRWESLCRKRENLRFADDLNDALAAGPFDLVICRRVLCTIEDIDEFRTILSDLRNLVSDRGRVLVTVCDPNFTFGGSTPEADRELPPDARYESVFKWIKRVRETGRVHLEVHRPERTLRREFALAGLAVCRRVEVPTIDLERFEPSSDQLVFELSPIAPLPGEVTLMIKACGMEAATLDVQVRHLVSQLETSRAFAERILVIDSREDEFLRQHTSGNLADLYNAARRLEQAGWIDRIVDGPNDVDDTVLLHKRWFGIPCRTAHAYSGAQIASTLNGFDACSTRYVLQLDVDVMVGRLDRSHDYLAEMLSVLQRDPEAVTVSFNVAMDHDRPYTEAGETGAWRVEVRAGLIDLQRLFDARPLPNRLRGERLEFHWYRALDRRIAQGRGRSYRGGDRRTFFVHPPNVRKRNITEWFAILDRIEHGVVPYIQFGNVDWVGDKASWMGPQRFEQFVFVVSGRNVQPGRFRRCIESMARQKGAQWGAVVIDDASDPMFAEHFEIACRPLVERCTVIRNRRRCGLLVNMVTAIREFCANPESVIVTLDSDDALIGDRVLERLAAEYDRGADVTVGTMLRTDKDANYPVCFDQPRRHRGGNVWQHLRSFKKRLFDAIPDDALRLDGDYIDLANDWAYMLPIVEMADMPVHIAEPLYLYEPSGIWKGADRALREEVIARIVAKDTLYQDETCDAYSGNIDARDRR